MRTGLTKVQKRVLAALLEAGWITRDDLMTRMGRHVSGPCIRGLEREGMVARDESVPAHWTLTAEGQEIARQYAQEAQ